VCNRHRHKAGRTRTGTASKVHKGNKVSCPLVTTVVQAINVQSEQNAIAPYAWRAGRYAFGTAAHIVVCKTPPSGNAQRRHGKVRMLGEEGMVGSGYGKNARQLSIQALVHASRPAS